VHFVAQKTGNVLPLGSAAIHPQISATGAFRRVSVREVENTMTRYTLGSVHPYFAPLSAPMIKKAVLSQEDESGLSTALNLDDVVSTFAAKYARLRQRLIEPRRETYDDMRQALASHQLTTDWMLDKLSLYTPHRGPDKPLSAEALSRWRETGLVVYRDRDEPDTDNGAALIVLRRLIPNRERGWVPSPPRGEQRANYYAHEPLWWAWRQDSPSSPIIPCPVPLPKDIPARALLWTDWLGATWKPAWLRIGDLGCCRWAGTFIEDSTMLWALAQEDLELWGVAISKEYRQALKNDMALTLHTLATNALLLLATQRLEDLHTFSLAYAG